MHKITLLVVLILLSLGTSALAATTPLRVVVSFSVLGDIVKKTGGETVVVRSLVPTNADTHSYQPTPEDAKALTNADLVFVNGLGFEGWMQRLITASGYKGKVIIASEGITPRHVKDSIDPHAWQNLANGRIYVKNIAAALTEVRPNQAKSIRAHAATYDAQLAKMDTYVRQQFSGIPQTQRTIITNHDAFGYFGDAYGVTFLAPAGLNTDEGEPTATDIARLIDQIKALGVKRVFLENMTSPKLISQIAKDSGAQMGGSLYSDALSDDDGGAPDYLGMFRNNVPKLRAAMLITGK